MISDMPHSDSIKTEMAGLAKQIQAWGKTLGFQQIGITDVDLGDHEQHLHRWLAQKHHGELGYMEAHGNKRSRPEQLIPGTLRVISARMDYLTTEKRIGKTEQNPNYAQVSRYALGRDYHKLIRKRLTQLAKKIETTAQKGNYRAFVDSAPVLERALAEKAGLGWIGKNTMLLTPNAGSYFFLGEIYTNLPLPTNQSASSNHCGSCSACLDICPTDAFVGPYILDARKCISYLTIELKGSIPEPLRRPMGNRIFGCDDCQTACPWNKFANFTDEQDFQPRNNLDEAELLELFSWSEQDFLSKTEGSAIRRTGYQGWLRNIAVALGNAPTSQLIVNALKDKSGHSSELVREHVAWALQQHKGMIATIDS